MLPEWLIADDPECTRTFIIHTTPGERFVAEVHPVPGQPGREHLEPEWIDPVDLLPLERVRQLMAAAARLYGRSLEDPGQHN